MTDPTEAEALSALAVLFSSTVDQPTRKAANQWLESFQKTPSAWTICDQIIKNQQLQFEARLFSAQTFRQKVYMPLRRLNMISTNSPLLPTEHSGTHCLDYCLNIERETGH
jgi:transportin-3